MEKMEANLSLSTKSLVQQPLKVLTSSYSAFHLKKFGMTLSMNVMLLFC